MEKKLGDTMETSDFSMEYVYTELSTLMNDFLNKIVELGVASGGHIEHADTMAKTTLAIIYHTLDKMYGDRLPMVLMTFGSLYLKNHNDEIGITEELRYNEEFKKHLMGTKNGTKLRTEQRPKGNTKHKGTDSDTPGALY